MKGYGQFCPVAKGAEIFAERWTPLVLRELMSGSHRFNQIRNGVPLMSPTMLSQRLKTLVDSGVVERRMAEDGRTSEYFLTDAGEELRPIIEALGVWGNRWVQHEIADQDLDPGLLMWDMRRRITPTTPPDRRVVISFTYTDVPSTKSQYWLVVEKNDVDLCVTHPGHDVDLELTTTARLMARIWLGLEELRDYVGRPSLKLEGARDLVREFPDWLKLSVFAAVERKERDKADTTVR